jgi:hypothetical protein
MSANKRSLHRRLVVEDEGLGITMTSVPSPGASMLLANIVVLAVSMGTYQRWS